MDVCTVDRSQETEKQRELNAFVEALFAAAKQMCKAHSAGSHWLDYRGKGRLEFSALCPSGGVSITLDRP